MTDNQRQTLVPTHQPAENAGGSIQEGRGCLCKKELHAIIRPHVSYNSRTIDAFFTDELLSRCGISRQEMKRIRVFPVEINFVVVTHLKTNQLI